MSLTSHDPVPTQRPRRRRQGVLPGQGLRPHRRGPRGHHRRRDPTYACPDFPAWDRATARLIIVVLMLLMAVKFWIVAYVFMHLRFDKKILTVVFYSGLVLAVLVYLAMLSMFRIW